MAEKTLTPPLDQDAESIDFRLDPEQTEDVFWALHHYTQHLNRKADEEADGPQRKTLRTDAERVSALQGDLANLIFDDWLAARS